MRGFAPARRGSFDSAQDRLFCYGKRTQSHWRPGVAPMGAFAPVPIAWASFDFRRVAPYAQDERIITPRSSVPPPARPERNGVESKGAQTVLAAKEISGPGRSHARRRREMAIAFLVILDRTTLDSRPRSGSGAGSRKDDRKRKKDTGTGPTGLSGFGFLTQIQDLVDPEGLGVLVGRDVL